MRRFWRESECGKPMGKHAFKWLERTHPYSAPQCEENLFIKNLKLKFCTRETTSLLFYSLEVKSVFYRPTSG